MSKHESPTPGTTEDTTPLVVDRLYAFIAHLAKHNIADLGDKVGDIEPRERGLLIRFDHDQRAALIAIAKTMPAPRVRARLVPGAGREPRDFHAVTLASTMAGVPVELWIAVYREQDDTPESVEASVIVELASKAAA